MDWVQSTQKRVIKQNNQHRNWFPRFISRSSSRSTELATDEADGEIRKTVRKICRALKIDHSYFLEVASPLVDRLSGWLEQTWNAVKNSGTGPYIGRRASTRDITDRKRAKATISESEEFNRTILASLSDHIAIIDNEGWILAVNEAWMNYARSSGATQSSTATGSNYLEVCRRSAEAGDGLARAAFNGVRAVLTGKRKTFTLEYPCHTISKQQWYLMKVVDLKSADGGAVISHSDITERRRAEQALREKDRTLDEAERICRVGSYEWDLTTGMINGSQEAARIFDREPRVGGTSLQEVLTCLHPDDIKTVTGTCEQMMEELPDKIDMEYRIITPDGTERFVHQQGEVLFDKDHSPVKVAGTVRDITERKQAEEALRHTTEELRKSQNALRVLTVRLLSDEEDERRRVARELHDDFTQRLASLAIEMGKVELKVTAPFKSLLQNLREQVVGLSADIHELSRRLHPSILDDLGLVKAIEAECRRYSSTEGLDVRFLSRGVPDVIEADIALSLYRIVQEALQNVLKHSRTEKAYVSLVCHGHALSLCVDDEGIGFDQEQVKGKGGIGLESMKERALAISGTLSVESQPGQGTSIEVRVTVRQEAI